MIVTTTDAVPKYGKNWKITESMIHNLAEQFRTQDRPMRIDQLFGGMEVRA